jgi:hypothetical protein
MVGTIVPVKGTIAPMKEKHGSAGAEVEVRWSGTMVPLERKCSSAFC